LGGILLKLLRSRGPMARSQRQRIRFQRQPPGTAITRTSLVVGGCLAAAGAWLIVAREPKQAAIAAGASAVLLLIGGHRANHGAGGPTDRMLDELLDRGWDAAILGSIAWAARSSDHQVAIGALVAMCLSFLSAYVRARGAALGYSVEESHVTRGIRYALIVAGLGFGWLGWTVWVAAGLAALTAAVRTGQVAAEERA
jgi:hypothetical protein